MAYNRFAEGAVIPRHVNELLHDYRAKARIIDRQASCEPMSYNFRDFNTTSYVQQYSTVYYQNVIEISLAEDDLNKLIDNVGEVKDLQQQYGPNIMHFIRDARAREHQHSREYAVRKNNPGVQLAWDKYQMMLKIAGGE